MRVLLLVAFAGLLGVVAPLLFFAETAETAEVRPGFEDRLVTQVSKPTSMAFMPNGRMLVTTQPGLLQVYDPATGSRRTALDLTGQTCSNSERGLLGVAVDPDFESNRHVYLYYTFNRFGECPTDRPTYEKNPVNRVARYTLPDGGNASFDKVLIDNIPSPKGNHNAGDLHFGKDGYLYVSVGDGGSDYRGDSGGGGENDASRDPHVLLGKILRVTRDGGIPATNPYTGPDSGRCNETGRTAAGDNCQETFARGLRNPFRMAFDPDAEGTRFNINDVGQNAWEEIDPGRRGADYGWNLCEGRQDNPSRPGSANCTTGGYTPPIHEYPHTSGCSSVTGGAFVPDGGWPAGYDESYLFGDYVCGSIFSLTPDGDGGYTKATFASGLGRGGPVAMTFGPTGRDLYYTTYANGDGQIRRITYPEGNAVPLASIEANPPYAETPGDLTIDFDAAGSRDEDGDTLTYEWDFDYDGTTFQPDPSAKDATTPSHTYAGAGKKTAALRVTDDQNRSDVATIEVYPGDTPPEPVIESPAPGARFGVGQRITLRGSAGDAEGAGAPDLAWEVIRHHNNSHTHPVADAGNVESFTITGPEPEDLFATNPNGNYLEIRLKATQDNGLSKTVSRRLEPRTVNVAFGTSPAGLRLVLNGRQFNAPKTFLSWEGARLNVNAPRQRRDGQAYVFGYWSDGRAAQHTIISPSSYKKYTATFRRR